MRDAYMPTPLPIVEQMLDAAQLLPSDIVLDLGSGDARICLAAARRGARAVGCEVDRELVWKSRARIQTLGLADRILIIEGDVMAESWTSFDVITAFVSDEDAVIAKFRQEADPGARLVLRGARALEVICQPSA